MLNAQGGAGRGGTSIKATFKQAYYCLLKQSLQLILFNMEKKKKKNNFIYSPWSWNNNSKVSSSTRLFCCLVLFFSCNTGIQVLRALWKRCFSIFQRLSTHGLSWKRCSNSSYDVLLECPNTQYIVVFQHWYIWSFYRYFTKRLPKSESERRTIVVRWRKSKIMQKRQHLAPCRAVSQIKQGDPRVGLMVGLAITDGDALGRFPPPFSPVLILLFPRLSQYLSPLWVLTLQLCVVSCLLIFPLASPHPRPYYTHYLSTLPKP